MTTTWELVVDEGDGEELVATGTRRKLERELDHLLADYREPDGELHGQPEPPYRIQPAQ